MCVLHNDFYNQTEKEIGMKRKRRSSCKGAPLFLTALIMFSVFFVSDLFAADITVIANTSVGDAALSKDAIKEIYTGKQVKWADGSKIQLSAQKKNDTHETFTREYVGKNPSQFRMFWKKMVFTGKGKAPTAFESDADIIKYVAETEGAIGYVSSGAAVDGVKTITIGN